MAESNSGTTVFPGVLDDYANPGTATFEDDAGYGHSTIHTQVHAAIEAIETTVGTTAGTGALGNFAAGDLCAKQDNDTLGSPLIQGGTVANALIGTSQITGGSIANAGVIGTSQITGGTVQAATMAGVIAYGDNAPNIGVKSRAFLGTAQANLVDTAWTKVLISNESYDIGGDFDTTNYYFVAPVTGYYLIVGQVMFASGGMVALKRYGARLNKNAGTELSLCLSHSALADSLIINVLDVVALAANDTVQLDAVSYSGDNAVDLVNGTQYTFLTVHLISV